MIIPESLARATLDTLPINVAVLDADGTILYTNRAWREFGGREGLEDASMTGENYLEAADEGDAYARQAVGGIESVLAGEREFFRLEYPCHSPEQKRWFVLRVAPLSDAAEGSAVVAHVDITQRKLAELRAQRRAEDLRAERERVADLLERVNGLVANVTAAVVAADTRADIEAAVPGEFVAVEPYRTAWVGRTDLRNDTVSPVAWAGTGEGPTDVPIPLDPSAEPTVEAARSGRVVVTPRSALAESSIHRYADPDAAAVVAVPLSDGGTLYGVVHLYAARSTVDERERTVLRALGNVIATAIDAAERRRMLVADDTVEIELSVSDPAVHPAALSTAADCRLEYGSAISREDGTVLQFFAIEGADRDALRRAAAERDVGVTRLATGNGADRYELAVSDSPLLDALADHGAEIHDLVAEDGVARFTLRLSSAGDARALFDRLEGTLSEVDLLAHRDLDEPVRTDREFDRTLRERLTERQLTALQKAYVGGFFDWPRSVSGEDLAATMDISPSTYHQHLRVAERKLLAAFFGR